jgi:hypothetical protein
MIGMLAGCESPHKREDPAYTLIGRVDKHQGDTFHRMLKYRDQYGNVKHDTMAIWQKQANGSWDRVD